MLTYAASVPTLGQLPSAASNEAVGKVNSSYRLIYAASLHHSVIHLTDCKCSVIPTTTTTTTTEIVFLLLFFIYLGHAK